MAYDPYAIIHEKDAEIERLNRYLDDTPAALPITPGAPWQRNSVMSAHVGHSEGLTQ